MAGCSIPRFARSHTRRELFDRRLMRIVADRRMPVFGIGAGMQLLNVTMGGNLLLHIPEDRPGSLPHHDPIDPAHRHTLEITPNSLMERVYGDGELRVNSMHHMAIDEVAQNFEVTARCPDGIIEAIESRNPGLVRDRHAVPSGGRYGLGAGSPRVRGIRGCRQANG